eukprot:SAG11_NODE_34391_length_272_cov_0.601156_1_plen_21_part_01
MADDASAAHTIPQTMPFLAGT